MARFQMFYFQIFSWECWQIIRKVSKRSCRSRVSDTLLLTSLRWNKKYNWTLCLESSMRKIERRTLLFPLFALFCYEQSHDPLSLEFSTKPSSKKTCYLYSTTKHKILVIKSIRMRWTVHVTHMGSGRGLRRVLVGISEGRGAWGSVVVKALRY